MTSPPHLLHVFSTFTASGPQLRIVATINHLGGRFRHTIIAMDGVTDAKDRFDGSAEVQFLGPPVKKGSWMMPLAFRDLLKKNRPDLVLSYNWGAIESVAGALLAGQCPVIHNEAGFGGDEAVHRKKRRAFARSLLLRGAFNTLVPSKNLLRIARNEFYLPASRVRYIANGVDTNRFHPGLDRAYRTSLGVTEGTLLFGFVGLLRPVKNLELLLRAFAAANIANARLVLVGDGPNRTQLEALGQALCLDDRLIWAGSTQDTPRYYAAFDVFVMSSVTEQMPMAMIEAMACGLPVISTRVGDVADILGSSSPPEVVPSNDLEGYAAALRTLALDSDLRNALGAKNRERCLSNYTFKKMAELYGDIWLDAIEDFKRFR